MSSSRTQTPSKNRSANERRRLPKRKTLDLEKMDTAMRSDFLKAWKFLTRWGFAQPGLVPDTHAAAKYLVVLQKSSPQDLLEVYSGRNSLSLKQEKRKLTTVYIAVQ